MAKTEIKTWGGKVGRAGRENVAVGINLRIVLVARFSSAF